MAKRTCTAIRETAIDMTIELRTSDFGTTTAGARGLPSGTIVPTMPRGDIPPGGRDRATLGRGAVLNRIK